MLPTLENFELFVPTGFLILIISIKTYVRMNLVQTNQISDTLYARAPCTFYCVTICFLQGELEPRRPIPYHHVVITKSFANSCAI